MLVYVCVRNIVVSFPSSKKTLFSLISVSPSLKNIVFSEKRYFLLKYIPTDAILYIEVMLMDKINFISSCCLDIVLIVISNIIFLLLGYIMGRPERVEKIKESLKKDNNEVYEAYEPIE